MFRAAKRIHFLYFCIDSFLIFISFYVPYSLRFASFGHFDLSAHALLGNYLREYSAIFIFWAILILTSFNRKNLFTTDRTLSIPREIYLVLSTLLITSILVATVIFLAQMNFFSRFIFSFSLVLMALTLSGWRVIKRLMLRYLIRSGFHNFNVLIIGTGDSSKSLIEEIKMNPYLGLNITGVIETEEKRHSSFYGFPVVGSTDDIEDCCKKYFIEDVFIASYLEKKVLGRISSVISRLKLGLHMLPTYHDEIFTFLKLNHVGIVPLLTFKEREALPTDVFLKRASDLALSLILFILLFPFLLAIAIVIKFDSPGPVFFIQKRTGRKGRIFKFYKFRTMTKDADKLKKDLMPRNEVKDGIIFKIKEDPRITRFGKCLRRFSLDELPQLINVIKGDMSIVGPRPFPVEESLKFNNGHMPRLNIRPGITGLAQVRGRSDLTFGRWVKWDLWYVNHWSFLLDLQIIWLTIPAVFKGKGAY